MQPFFLPSFSHNSELGTRISPIFSLSYYFFLFGNLFLHTFWFARMLLCRRMFVHFIQIFFERCKFVSTYKGSNRTSFLFFFPCICGNWIGYSCANFRYIDICVTELVFLTPSHKKCMFVTLKEEQKPKFEFWRSVRGYRNSYLLASVSCPSSPRSTRNSPSIFRWRYSK